MSSIKEKTKAFDIDLALDSIDLTFPNYSPTEDSLEFFNIIRLVQGADFEYRTPLAHYWLVDLVFGNIKVDQFPYSEIVKKTLVVDPTRIAVMMSRGLAKSSVITSFIPVYIAVKGTLPGYGKAYFMLTLAASTQSGSKVINKAIQSLCEDSVFCKEWFEEMRFTETEIEWVRKGKGPRGNRAFLHRSMGIGSGIRGQRSNYGVNGATVRPDIIAFDDVILNSAAAYSDTIMANIKETIASDAINALRGGGHGRIWLIFTPFHMMDANVLNITSGAYTPVVIPIAEKVYEGITKEDFVGAWEDMHSYDSVVKQYEQAVRSNSTRSFNQERMLRISSEDDRMVPDNLIQEFDRVLTMKAIQNYSLYITTDFTTTSKSKSDFSALGVWAINSNNDWFLMDLCVKRQSISEQYDELFRMVKDWGRKGCILEVAIEVDGQQGAHLAALKREMNYRNVYFNFARQVDYKGTRQGILSKSVGGNKHSRFRMILPQFQNKKIYFAEQLHDTPDMKEALLQLKHTTWGNFGGHDDFCDIVSQLNLIELTLPMGEYEPTKEDRQDSIWDEIYDEDEGSAYGQYS